jgi:hypothetical protein
MPLRLKTLMPGAKVLQVIPTKDGGDGVVQTPTKRKMLKTPQFKKAPTLLQTQKVAPRKRYTARRWPDSNLKRIMF